MAETAQRGLESSVQGNKPLRAFIDFLSYCSTSTGPAEKQAAARLCVAGTLLCLALATTEKHRELAKASRLLISTIGLVPNIDEASGGEALNTIQAAGVIAKRSSVPKAIYSELYRDLTAILQRGRYCSAPRLAELSGCRSHDGLLAVSSKSMRAAIDLDEDSLDNLEDYLEACVLMLRCKSAAYGLTSACWGGVCHTILKPE
jgi:hypothetical protein